MKTYEELVREYRKRQHDTVVDTIATGLTYVDEIAVDSGRLEETGAAVTVMTGFWAAIPVTMGVRALFDRYRSKALTGKRVEGRIKRLQELNKFIRRETGDTDKELLPEGTGAGAAVQAAGEVQ